MNRALTDSSSFGLFLSVLSGFLSFSLTWYAFGNPRPRPILANGRGVVRFLELGQTADIDRLRVGHAGAGSTVGHETVRDVGHDTGGIAPGERMTPTSISLTNSTVGGTFEGHTLLAAEGDHCM